MRGGPYADRASFGRWLKARRTALDLTREALGARVGCASETISRWEDERERPSHELATNLARQLDLDGEQAARFACVASAAAPAPAVQLQSRLPLTPLVGRCTERATLCGLIERPEVRLVTLLGMPGVGKTRLALQVAADLAPQFADGAVVVPLASVESAAAAGAAIAAALGAGEGETPPLECLARRLNGTHLLLVLDNLEHIGGAALLVSELLQWMPGLTVLATSRSPLHVYGEHRYTVPPLHVPTLEPLPSLDEIAECEAVRLFVGRAQAVQHDFGLTAENARTIVEICSRLEGVPLAIELAVSRLNLYAPHELLLRLDDPLQVLSGGPRDVPERHQSLRAAIAWSFGLLSHGAQTLLCRLAGLEPSFGVAELTAASSGEHDEPDALAELLNLQLLRQEYDAGGVTRYTMPLAIRAFGLERLAERSAERESETDRVAALSHNRASVLTRRQAQVLRLLAHGFTYEQIAQQLVISPRTVGRHLTAIYSKLDVSSRHAATRWAQQQQLA